MEKLDLAAVDEVRAWHVKCHGGWTTWMAQISCTDSTKKIFTKICTTHAISFGVSLWWFSIGSFRWRSFRLASSLASGIQRFSATRLGCCQWKQPWQLVVPIMLGRLPWKQLTRHRTGKAAEISGSVAIEHGTSLFGTKFHYLKARVLWIHLNHHKRLFDFFNPSPRCARLLTCDTPHSMLIANFGVAFCGVSSAIIFVGP